MADKKADLAGPGIGDYGDLARELPDDYEALLSPMERMKAVFALKNYIEANLCKELNLQMVQVPLIVDKNSGVNDYLDRDGSRTPVEFPCGLGLDNPITAQVVQAATKWKRMALQQFGCKEGEGVCTDMKAVRKDYFLDHDHSAYVDQWDWELVMTEEQRSLDFLKDTITKIWKVIWEPAIWCGKCFLNSRPPNTLIFQRNSHFFMLKRFSSSTRICRGNNVRLGFLWRKLRRFSS